MGAFLHMQKQEPKNPFNISLELPPLENPQITNKEFPFPCIDYQKPKENIVENRKNNIS